MAEDTLILPLWEKNGNKIFVFFKFYLLTRLHATQLALSR